MHLFTSSKGCSPFIALTFHQFERHWPDHNLDRKQGQSGRSHFHGRTHPGFWGADLENSYTIAEDDPSVSSGKRTLSIEASTPGVYHIIQENASKYVVTAFSVADPSQDRYKRVRAMRDGYTLIYPDGNTDFTTWEEVEAEEDIQE